ncbi:MAG: RagB/SusD family nutrient uptake outer membrane protein [Flavicella sp.]
MKNIFKTSLLFILCSTILFSCDDTVDILPIAPNSENYFNNEEEYEDALIGVYDMLQTTMFNVMVAHTASDDIIAGGDPNTFDQPTLQNIDKMEHTPANNDQIQQIWQLMYAAVNRANYVLEFKDKTDFDGKDDVIAQVYFLRAYFVFELCKYFGDIPLFTEKRNEVQRIVDSRVLFGDQYTINRVGSVDAVYALIEEDLKEAIPNLATSRPSTEVYKITKSTAQALLGKVYLYHKKYADAAEAFDAVITSGEYELVTGSDFTNLFTADGENSSESVFEIQYTGVVGNNWDCLYCNAGNYMPQSNGPRASFSHPTFKEGWGINIFTKNINDLYQSGDLRKNVTIFAPNNGSYGESRENSGFYNKKYLVRKNEPTVSTDPVSYQNNYRVIRYSDVLLMAAEAEAQSNGANAIDYLNDVRERAFGNTSHDYPYNGESDLLKAIYNERRLELAGEGHRFFDLVRTNKAKEAFDAYNDSLTGDNIEEREINFTVGTNEIFPIPLVELNLANAVETWGQNPGYN